MQKSFTLKIASIFAIALVLLIPINMVKSKLDERRQYRDQAVNSVKESWTGEQVVVSPVLVILYKDNNAVLQAGQFNQQKPTNRRGYRTIIPEHLRVTITSNNDSLRKGIYPIAVYNADITMEGTFSKHQLLSLCNQIRRDYGADSIQDIQLVFRTSDHRGIKGQPHLEVNGKQANTKSYRATALFKDELRARLDADGQHASATRFKLKLTVAGMEQLSIIPVAAESDITMTSSWPHPEFTGASLPLERTLTNTGFSARWTTADLSGEYQDVPYTCRGESLLCAGNQRLAFGVRFIEPVDIYLKSERAIKYAMLIIGLSFCVFFLFEVLKKIQIHPIQYGFVGLAIATFYLLLLSLSEHLAFNLAYGISVGACCLLLLTYLNHVLHSLFTAYLFSIALMVLYLLLFIILQAEDYAQLMGSILVFATLAALMLSTRKLNWYEVTGFDETQLTRSKKTRANLERTT